MSVDIQGVAQNSLELLDFPHHPWDFLLRTHELL